MVGKLFKNTEEKMKEAMLFGLTPVGGDIKRMLDEAAQTPAGKMVALNFKPQSMYRLTEQDVQHLMSEFAGMQLGLVYCEEAGLIFADMQALSTVADKLRANVLKDENLALGIGWVVLVRMLWDSGIPIAALKVFLEGFELNSFTKAGKAEKKFIRKHSDY